MDEILRLAEDASHQGDFLSKYVSEMGGPEQLRTTLTNRRDVNWSAFMAHCREKAESVFRGVRERGARDNLTMDEATERHVRGLTLREALGRQLQSLLAMDREGRSERSIASPFTEGARFNQIPSDALQAFLARGQAKVPAFVRNEWIALAILDCERAERTGSLQNGNSFIQLSPKDHMQKFPALISIAELLAALPRELNLKLNSRFTEVHDEVWAWTRSFNLPPPSSGSAISNKVVAGLVFSRDEEKTELKLGQSSQTAKSMQVTRSTLILASVPPPYTSLIRFTEGSKFWMICVAFDAV